MRFLFLSLILTWTTVQGQQYIVQNYTTADGLPHNVVFDIMQDREYRLWVATLDGVAWYDGQQFTRFTKSDGLADSRVWSATQLSNGDFWFGTRAGATRLQFREGRPIFSVWSARHGLPSDNVTKIVEDSRHHVWFCSANGVLCIPLEDASRDTGLFNNCMIPGGLPPTRYVDIVEDGKGRLWMATRDEVYIVKDGQSECAVGREVIGKRQIRKLFVDRTGVLWILGHDGLMGRLTTTRVGYSVEWPVLPAGLQSLTFYDILEDDNGWFWISTNEGAGQIRVNGRAIKTGEWVDDRNGLINPIVLPIIRDHERNIWLGTHNGLSRLTSPGVKIYLPGGRRYVSVFRVADNGSHGVWLGSAEGLFMLDLSTGLQRRIEAVPVTQIFDVVLDGERAWVGGESGLWVLDAYSNRLVKYYAEFAPMLVSSILVDQEIWIGTNQGLYQIHNGRAEQYPGIQQLRVNSLSRGVRHIWVGTNQGAFELRPDGELVQHWTARDGLPSMEIGRVFRDSRDHVWFSTEGSGIARWDGEKMKIISEGQGLSNNVVYDITEPFRGQLWIAHAKGIDRLQLDDLSIDRLTYHEGFCIKGAITYRLDPAADSVMWVSTSLGAVQLRLPQLKPVRFELPVRVKRFVANREDLTQQLAQPGVAKLSYDQNEIDVEIGALSFLYGPDLLYQFKLDGIDRDWSALSASNVIRYFSLPPGSYELQARTVTPNQTVEGLQIHFTIDKPFWQKAWFLLIAVMATVSMAFGLYRWRTRALSRRAEALAFEVRSRTQDLATQKAELEKTLAVLKETQVQLIQAEKLSSLGQLVAGIAHEINNPLSVVYGNLPLLENDLKRLGERTSEVESAKDKESAGDTVRSIRSAARRIMDIVETLRRFSRLDEATYKDAVLEECIENAIQILKFQYPNVIVDVSGAAGLIHCYPQELQQAAYHIMLNGVQAEEGGTHRLTVEIGRTDSSAFVTIRDFGKGIPPAIQSRIFDPFFTTKDVGEGRGLGLSLAYGIIQKHRGRIDFDTSSAGTVFTIHIPVDQT